MQIYFIQHSEACQVWEKYSVSMKATFWGGEIGLHVFSGKTTLKFILERPQDICPRHWGSKNNMFTVVSSGVDKPRARENQSFNRQCPSAGLCRLLLDVMWTPALDFACSMSTLNSIWLSEWVKTPDKRQTQQLLDHSLLGFLWSCQTLLFMFLSLSFLLCKCKLFYMILRGWI